MQTNFKINNSIAGKEMYNNSDTIIKLVDSKMLVNAFNKNFLKIPQFQRDIDLEKINNIKNMITNNANNWLIQQGFITIGVVDMCSDSYYIIDGQHRFIAIKEIIESNINYNHPICIIIIRFNTTQQMESHFATINTNTQIEPIYLYFNNEVIRSTILKVKDWLSNTFGKAFRKTKNKTDSNHNYHIDEFISLFNPDAVKKLYDDSNNGNYNDVDFFKDSIMRGNSDAQLKLLEMQVRNVRQYCMTNKDYDKCSNNNFFIAYDNINISDFIFNNLDDIEIGCPFKPKIKIPSKLRKEVWKKRNGSNMNGTCFCCNDNLEIDNFHAGHIIAEILGGQTILSNLEPICIGCNLGMGTQNLNDFKRSLFISLQ